MEDFVKIFKSPQGDVYHITLSESNDILSKSVLEALGDVHIAGVDLRRSHARGQVPGSSTQLASSVIVHFSGAEKKNQRDITHPRPSLKVGMQPLLLSLFH